MVSFSARLIGYDLIYSKMYNFFVKTEGLEVKQNGMIAQIQAV